MASSIYKGGSGTPCTQKHTTSTCTRTPILHVRKTRPAYIHNYPNSACTQNTFFVRENSDQNGSQGTATPHPERTAHTALPASG